MKLHSTTSTATWKTMSSTKMRPLRDRDGHEGKEENKSDKRGLDICPCSMSCKYFARLFSVCVVQRSLHVRLSSVVLLSIDSIFCACIISLWKLTLVVASAPPRNPYQRTSFRKPYHFSKLSDMVSFGFSSVVALLVSASAVGAFVPAAKFGVTPVSF